MRHACDGASAVIDAASQVLAVRGRPEPVETQNPEIAWGAVAREGVWVPTRDGRRVRIGLTGTAADRAAAMVRPGLRVFVGFDTDTDLMAQTTATGVRFIAVLHGPGAPVEFRFPIRLADGLSLDPAPSGGYDVVHERYGATVGRFTAPWGCDSLYRPITATYRLDGTVLVMTVEHRDADACYPVVADSVYVR